MSSANALFAGLTTLDLAYVVDAFPAANAKIAAESQEVTAGGPAANAAVTFAHFAGSATLVSVAGAHPLSHIIHTDLNACAVHLCDAAPDAAAPPPVSSICVLRSTGERTVVSANAKAFASLRYHFEPAWLDQANLVLVDGHHLPLALEVAAEARRRGLEVVLDGGSWKPGLERLLPFVTIAICSDDFVAPPPGLHSFGTRDVAVTRGHLPILYWSREVHGEVAVPDVKPVDTLGAGDIFHGAFCWALSDGAEFPAALAFAAEVASESCLHWGTRSWREHVPPGFLHDRI